MLPDMQNTNKTAGQTAKTKPFWGIVAVIGFMVACTMGNNLIMAGIGTAMFGLGAYLGGYMNETSQKLSNNLASPAKTGERRAA